MNHIHLYANYFLAGRLISCRCSKGADYNKEGGCAHKNFNLKFLTSTPPTPPSTPSCKCSLIVSLGLLFSTIFFLTVCQLKPPNTYSH